MIVKRNRAQADVPRMIVRRSRETVGARSSRRIVRRNKRVMPATNWDGETETGTHGRRLSLRAWTWTFTAALLIGLGTYGAWWTWESPAFRVNHVRVTGNDRTSTDEIVQAAEILGDSMFTSNLADAQEVLYSFPLLASVEVQRDWPNTIRITVEERQAWGTWVQADVRYTIDRDGVVLGTEPLPAGSPQIKSGGSTTLRVGDRVDYQAVAAAAEIYEKLPRQLGTTVTEIAYLTGSGVQVTTASGQRALFGDSSSIPYKLSVWAALSTEARDKGISYTTIDLRYGSRPVLY